jgi:SAM-dependent methyltransferase
MIALALRNHTLKLSRTARHRLARAQRGAERWLAKRAKHVRRAVVRQGHQLHKTRRSAARKVTAAATSMVDWLGARLDAMQRTRQCPGCGHAALTRLPLVIHKRPGPLGLSRRTWMAGCEQCGLVFGTYRPTPKTLASYYDTEGEWSRNHRIGSTKAEVPIVLFDAVDRAVPLKTPAGGARALDIGCGSGSWLNSLARYGWETCGIEPATKVAFARHRELSAIPTDASFDLAILHHVLEHVDAPGALLAEAAAALRPGGHLFLSVPNLDTVAIHRDIRYCVNGHAHLQAFTFACMKTLLARAGFDEAIELSDPALDRVTRRPALRLRVVARKGAAVAAAATGTAPLAAAWLALHRAGYVSFDACASLAPAAMHAASSSLLLDTRSSSRSSS